MWTALIPGGKFFTSRSTRTPSSCCRNTPLPTMRPLASRRSTPADGGGKVTPGMYGRLHPVRIRELATIHTAQRRAGANTCGIERNPARSGRRRSIGRSPSKEVLPERKGVPQNRCCHRHRKGGPVTERGRHEYAEVMRQRYQQASRVERGALLDEYCRVTGGHRKAAIRRLGAAPPGRGRREGRPRRYGRELLPMLEQVW